MYKDIVFATFVVSSGLVSMASTADVVDAAMDKAVEVAFSELEKEIIDKYYKKEKPKEVEEKEASRKSSRKTKGKKSKKGMPPGLAKRDELPPGLARKLEKNGSLPPGLAKKALPADLEKELPPPPEGYERQVVEDAAVVLVEKATGKSADVIKDAIGGASQ